MANSRKMEANREIEENILAILDPTGFKDSKDDHDDRLSFLEAVRAACIVPESATPPTKKMREAVLEILRSASSMELIVGSYQLLMELDERFFQVGTSDVEGSTSSDSPGEAVVVNEAWSPFALGSDIVSSERTAVADRNACVPLDSSGFYLLIEDLAELDCDTDFVKATSLKSLGKMFLLQYLVNALVQDFLFRCSKNKDTTNWMLLRESFLNRLLGSRRMSYKGLIKNCLSILCTLYHAHVVTSNGMQSEDSDAKSLELCNTELAVCLLESEKRTCTAIQKFLAMIMELDSSRKKADMQGCTTRADGVRTSVVEIVVDELTYNRDIISPFLQAFDEPKWKLEIVLQYFSKYTAKPAVRTRRSNGSTDDATLEGILKGLSNSTDTKSVIKKISSEVAQTLLGHAFLAYLSASLSSEENKGDDIADMKEGGTRSSLVHVCESFISAFLNLQRADECTEISPFSKQALFTATTIISTIS